MTNRRLGGLLLAMTLAMAIVFGPAALRPTQAQNALPPPVGDIAHGKYLVEGIGFCIFCHGQALQGQPMPGDAPPAPKIAGLPMFANDDAAITFFETGNLPNGQKARAPMRPFRFSHSDAVALVAYLRSLK